MSTNVNQMDAMEELRAVVARLRGPDGCPWDIEQTHESLRSSLIEESHEVVEAINKKDDAHLAEELGDLLLQVVMHSQIAGEEKRFDFDMVARGISEKLVRRHPHVFGNTKADDTAAVLKQWDEIKREERIAKGEDIPKEKTPSILDGISSAMPGLMRAQKTGVKVARVGFDWDDVAGSLAKVKEEVAEVEHEVESGDREKLEEELGDLLFAVVNFARHIKVDAELAAHAATNKFTRRFQKLEAKLHERGEKFEDHKLPGLDAIWEEVKREERNPGGRI